MKYLLKQNKEDKGILCDKVTIDGFEYYVKGTDSKRGWFYCYRTKILFKDEGCDINCCNSDINVLATNNPNIDIPKIVNEIEEILNTIYPKIPSGVYGHTLTASKRDVFIEGYNKSQETHPFSEEDVYDIMDFIARTSETKGMFKGDILELWKEQQPKIIYYE